MPWVKLDDRFWRHRKVRKAWLGHPRAVGLHVLALSYCGDEPGDGFVDPEWLEMQIAEAAERDTVSAVLIDAGLWEPFGDGWQIHDWLDYNPSTKKLDEVREARRLAGALGGKRSRGGGRPRQNGTSQ